MPSSSGAMPSHGLPTYPRPTAPVSIPQRRECRPPKLTMSSTRWNSIDDQLLHHVWASDQAMYPAPELTYEHLKSLTDACPELSISLRDTRGEDEQEDESGRDAMTSSETASSSSSSSAAVYAPRGPESTSAPLHGLIIVWPLLAHAHWKQLLDNTIKEHDVKATMFPPARCCGDAGAPEKTTPVGLHIFHIERFSAFQRTPRGAAAGFTRLALDEVRQRVARLESTKSWEVVGYSGERASAWNCVPPPLFFFFLFKGRRCVLGLRSLHGRT